MNINKQKILNCKILQLLSANRTNYEWGTRVIGIRYNAAAMSSVPNNSAVGRRAMKAWFTNLQRMRNKPIWASTTIAQ